MLAFLTLATAALGAASSAVQAQQSSSAASVTSTSSSSSSQPSLAAVIPSGLSSGCTAFLTALNSDATLGSCVTPLLQATNAAALASSPEALSGSLDKLCQANGCSSTFLRGRLTDFYGNCSTELADPTELAVRNLYDILYTVAPLKEVVCTQDPTSEAYCVSALSRNASSTAAAAAATSSASGSSSSGNNTLELSNAAAVNVVHQNDRPEHAAAGHLSAPSLSLVQQSGGGSSALVTPKKRALLSSSSSSSSSQNAAVVTTDSDGTYPNATTYRLTNLPYLFIQPSDPASILCSPCAKAVFGAYATWETSTTYALGLSESPILGGQADLWEAAATTCGQTWIAGIVNAATTTGSGVGGANGTSSSTAAGGGLGGAGLSAAGRTASLSSAATTSLLTVVVGGGLATVAFLL